MMLFRACALTAVLTACGSGGGFPDAPPPDSPVIGGTVSLQWSLTDTAGQPITCEQIAGQTVTLVLHNKSEAGATTEVFTCDSMAGTTPKVSPGVYDIRFELSGNVGLLAEVPAQDITVLSNQNATLQPITFVVEATGALDLKIDAAKSGGNCAGVAQNGAGITAMSITLTHSGDGACEPVTFNIASTPPRTYTVNCATPVETGCIDAAVSLTTSSVPSGRYQVHVRGKVGAAECYFNDDALTVPPLGRTLVRTLNLAYRTGTPGCP